MPKVELEAPYYPIVYVRGYAMTQDEVENTVATPYMGFNLGATMVRQRWTGQIQKHVFESPLLRLMKDHGYQDIYQQGAILPAGEKIPSRSIWIYRYYEEVSESLGSGERPDIEHYAEGLGDFIERIRGRMCGEAGDSEADATCAAFRVHIVAHSMGGLVARCYLQNICPAKGITPPVDKVFTYATPHGGIDVRGFGNVPSFLQINNVDNFNRDRMREYLKIGDGDSPRSLGKAFSPERFFCLIGTNHRDYVVGKGISRRLIGPMSDGLVRIENATVEGAPRAFVHRSHSGAYGIVNSEEGYQNLRRFLFGNVRVDGLLEYGKITLPDEVAERKAEGKKVRASYHLEVVTGVRGSRTDLHRRTANEESALFCDYDTYVKERRPRHLFSGFLLNSARVRAERESLGFFVDLRLLVPEYEVDEAWFNKDHYEGGYIYRDKVNLELALQEGEEPKLRYGFDSRTPNRTTQRADIRRRDDLLEFRIPLKSPTRSNPYFEGTLVLRAQPWA